MSKVKVAITGTLSMPRSEAVRLLEEKTNAVFSKSVSWDTSYLVAARFDTEKARRAAALGTVVITEKELQEFLSAGAFPAVPSLSKRKPPSNLPEIIWTKMADPDSVYLLRYTDRDGVATERLIDSAYLAVSADGSAEWLGAYDIERFKTFRLDRIEGLWKVNVHDGTKSLVGASALAEAAASK